MKSGPARQDLPLKPNAKGRFDWEPEKKRAKAKDWLERQRARLIKAQASPYGDHAAGRIAWELTSVEFLLELMKESGGVK